MNHIFLQQTTLGSATGIAVQAKNALPFLVSYKAKVVLSETDVQALSKMRTFSNNVINEIAVLAGNDEKYSSCLFMNFNGFPETIPEILTINDVTIDGKSIEGAPVELQKPWINLSPILGKRRSPSDPIHVNDIPRLQQLVVRALLSMSYNDSDRWLDPKLSSFIIESYSMTIASQLQLAFNLNFDEVRFIQTIFAIYYAQRLSSTEEDLIHDWPSILNRCAFLGSQSEITERLGMIEEDVGDDKTLSISKCCALLRKKGPPRMSTFEDRILYQMFSRGNVETSAMLYALDYPPYWVYLILKTMSNDKNPILATVFRITDLKKKAMLFCADLKISKNFIPKVKRNGD